MFLCTYVLNLFLINEISIKILIVKTGEKMAFERKLIKSP